MPEPVVFCQDDWENLELVRQETFYRIRLPT